MPANFDPKLFKRVFRKVLRNGQIRIPKDQEPDVQKERNRGRRSPYLGHCAQATAAAWVLGKELYKEQFDFKPYRSQDGTHYWLAKPTKGRILAKDRLDLTEHSSDPKGFDFKARNTPGWITVKSKREDLKCFHDALKIYDLAKEELSMH